MRISIYISIYIIILLKIKKSYDDELKVISYDSHQSLVYIINTKINIDRYISKQIKYNLLFFQIIFYKFFL